MSKLPPLQFFLAFNILVVTLDTIVNNFEDIGCKSARPSLKTCYLWHFIIYFSLLISTSVKWKRDQKLVTLKLFSHKWIVDDLFGLHIYHEFIVYSKGQCRVDKHFQEFWPSLGCLGFLGSYYTAPPLIVMTRAWLAAKIVVMDGEFWIVFLHPWKPASLWSSSLLSYLPFLASLTVSLLPLWPSRGSGRDTTTSSPRGNSQRYGFLGNPWQAMLFFFFLSLKNFFLLTFVYFT